MRVAVIFFGLARGTQVTVENIQRNIYDCNRQLGVSFTTFASLNLLERIDNPRAGELGVPLRADEALNLRADTYLLVRQNDAHIATALSAVQRWGDEYDNGWVSLRNVLHQLASLRRAWTMCKELTPGGFDYYLFLRPDLLYLDEICLPDIARNFRAAGSIVVPPWHSWGGFNDRFAFADPRAARHYAERIRLIPRYCAANPMHPEIFLAYALRRGGCRVGVLPARAKRVRANGAVRDERFEDSKSDLPIQPKIFSFVGRVRFHSLAILSLQVPYMLDLLRYLKALRSRLRRRLALMR
jgi:hypothetical protein